MRKQSEKKTSGGQKERVGLTKGKFSVNESIQTVCELVVEVESGKR